MIKVDVSVFMQILNFLILIWALNMVLYRPIRNILNQRRKKVEGLEGNIDSFTREKAEKDNAFHAGIRAARKEGMKKKDAMVLSAEEKEKEIISRINEKSQADLAKVRDDIAKSVEEVRLALLQQVDTFASEIGEKILGRSLS